MKNYLWKFHWDCGRSGDLEGLFVATEEEVQQTIGRNVNFGEVLGKHSEIYGIVEKDDIDKVELDSKTVEKVKNILGNTWSGYNPIMYAFCCERCGEQSYPDELDENNLCKWCREINSDN